LFVTRQRFVGVLQAARGGGAFVLLPDDVLMAVGGGSRFRVLGAIGGVEFESSTMPTGSGQVCLGVHRATRQAAAIDIGDDVVVEVERDDRPRTLDIPPDLVRALADDPAAQTAFDRLSFSHRREYVESLTGAKRAETRDRRLSKILDALHG
jgi:hypothetical protein